MEGSGSCSQREGKRKLDEGDDDDWGRRSAPKQQKIPTFGRVVLEALKKDGLEKIFLYFEPFIRKIFREEMQQFLLKNDERGKLGPLIHKILYEELHSALKTNIPSNLAGGSIVEPCLSLMPSPPRIQESGGRKLQLRFETKMPDHLFAVKKVKGEGGLAIHVILIDLSDGSVVKTGPESTAKLNVVVLQGDFDEDFNDGWTHEIFKTHKVKEREGKGPILIGDTKVTLKDGVGILGDLQFTDNSSWTRTKKFRLGVELAPGFCEGTCVMEAKTEAFAVLDQRGESYRKHYPPSLQDEVFRLKGIAKDKPLHKKLLEDGIATVEDLLRHHAKDPRKLRTMLGSSMTDKKWKSTIEHAKTSDLSGGNDKVTLESRAQSKEVSYLFKKAYENWDEVIECDDRDEIEACQEEQYSTPEPILQSQPDNTSEWPQSGFPFSNPNQTYMRVPNPETGSVGHSMYKTGETSGAGCSNSLIDSLQPKNGQGVENVFWKPDQIVDDEMEELQFINPAAGFFGSSMYETGETSGAWCFNSSEDPLPPNNGPMMERFVDDEVRDDTEFSFGVRVEDDMGLAAIINYSNEAPYSYGKAPYSNEPKYDEPFEVDPFEVDHGMNRRKAVDGWLKIIAALRWGLMVRKKVAERRRARLTELD